VSRPAFGLLGIAILLVMSSGPAAAEPPRFIDYLYINASEGSASGGHVALRFGDQVFHFEHRPPGILVLARAEFERFRHLYGDLENRTIQVSRIPVSDETYDLLLAQFSRHHIAQRQRFEALAAARGDRHFLAALLEPGVIAIAGLGLFTDAADAGAGAVDRASALDALRARVAARYGPEFIAYRTVELTARLAALEPEGPPGCSIGRSSGFAPLRIRSTYPAARRSMVLTFGPYDVKPPTSTNSRQPNIVGRRCRAASSTIRSRCTNAKA